MRTRAETDALTVVLANVHVRLGSHVVLSGIDIGIGPGSVVVLRGANGSGKTTLLRVLAGALRPTAGSRLGPARSAYVPAAIDPPRISARRWLEGIGRSITPPEPVLQRLEFRGDLTQACSRLSFGNLRKLMLAEALSSSARLILLDEPIAGLDDGGREALLPLVAEVAKRGVCVVIAEQDAVRWSSASRVIRIVDGALHEAERPQLSSVRLEGEASHLATVRALATKLGLREVEDD